MIWYKMQVSDLPYTPTNLQNLHENYSKTSHFTRITSKNRGINSYLYTSFSLAIVRVNARVLRIAESREMITKVKMRVARDCTLATLGSLQPGLGFLISRMNLGPIV